LLRDEQSVSVRMLCGIFANQMMRECTREKYNLMLRQKIHFLPDAGELDAELFLCSHNLHKT
jgi:hypothetical protein